LFGEQGSLEDLSLQKSETNEKPFKAGKIDIFTFGNMKNIGKINKITLKTDASGSFASWKVYSVLILKDSIERFL
jgi:hypothetical protein